MRTREIDRLEAQVVAAIEAGSTADGLDYAAKRLGYLNETRNHVAMAKARRPELLELSTDAMRFEERAFVRAARAVKM